MPGSRPDDAPRRAGRPRADARPVVGDPTDEILAAASRLFGELGVGGTPMSRIAAEVGLKQSSLYYYFGRKEQIVAALVGRANVVPLQLLRTIAEEGGSPASQLHRFVRADVVALCALPFDINDIHRIAQRDPEGFADYWRERASLERQLATLVRRGTAEGQLRRVDPRLAALTVLGNDEGVQNWFRTGTRWSAEKVGRHLADQAVGGLLAPGVDLDGIVAEFR
jgi:TetR/AcrR family transcriptional regulator